jgi:hypothetical protein
VRAVALFEESLTLFSSLCDERGITLALANLGLATFRLGDHDLAAARYREALVLGRDRGDKRLVAYMLGESARIAAVTGEPRRAARLFAASAALVEAQRLTWPVEYRTELDQVVARVAETLGREDFATISAEGRAMGVEQSIAYALQTASQTGT